MKFRHIRTSLATATNSSQQLIGRPMQLGFALLVAAVAGLLATDTTDAQSQFRATYSITYKGMSAGHSIKTVGQRDGAYFVDDHVAPNAFAELLGSPSYTHRSVFQIEDQIVTPNQFWVESDDQSETYNAKFDWNQGKVVFSNETAIDLPENPVLDNGAWYAALILGQSIQTQDQQVSILEGRKLYTYSYGAPVSEEITTKMGTVPAWRTTLQDVYNDNRRYNIWVAPDWGNIPVKIEKFKDKPTLVLELQSVE